LNECLPQNHIYSLLLSKQIDQIIINKGIKSIREVSVGLIELDIVSDRQGYGIISIYIPIYLSIYIPKYLNNLLSMYVFTGMKVWCIHIGGAGLISEVDGIYISIYLSIKMIKYQNLYLSIYLSTGSSAPISIRCITPIAHIDIDDMGFINILWNKLSNQPLLNDIIKEIIHIFNEPVHYNDDNGIGNDDNDNQEVIEKYNTAEQHTIGKLLLINEYKLQAKYPQLFNFNGEWSKLNCLCPSFIKACNEGNFADICYEITPGGGIYTFDIFTNEFCEILVNEIENFESSSLPRRRPNTMNNYGVIVNEIGLEPLITSLMKEYLIPMANYLYKDEIVSLGIDHHHSFIVQYKDKNGDLGLDMHHDASELTFNVCLGKDFTGGGLQFCGQFGSSSHRKATLSYKHVIGKGIFHIGRHRHGADTIITGERLNLIIWLRSSQFRNAAASGTIAPDGYPRKKEIDEPDIICLSRFNDEDYNKKLAFLTNNI
jgi:hypothetical protein